VVDESVTGCLNVGDLMVRDWGEHVGAGGGGGGVQVTLFASKSSITPLTCWKVAIASFLPLAFTVVVCTRGSLNNAYFLSHHSSKQQGGSVALTSIF
jgi:hypothetical protein